METTSFDPEHDSYRRAHHRAHHRAYHRTHPAAWHCEVGVGGRVSDEKEDGE